MCYVFEKFLLSFKEHVKLNIYTPILRLKDCQCMLRSKMTFLKIESNAKQESYCLLSNACALDEVKNRVLEDECLVVPVFNRKLPFGQSYFLSLGQSSLCYQIKG